ncbi:MAG: hypothetical protein ACKOS8_15255 [Gemmataceae bacterium]
MLEISPRKVLSDQELDAIRDRASCCHDVILRHDLLRLLEELDRVRSLKIPVVRFEVGRAAA